MMGRESTWWKRWFAVGWLLLPVLCSAQPHNGEVYRTLIDQYFLEHIEPIGEIQGEFPRRYFPETNPDTAFSTILKVALPLVRYKKLSDTTYLRSMDLTIALQDSTPETFSYRYADTLSNVNLRRMIRRSPDMLRGENPLAGAKWIRPISLIGLSVAGLVSLFFLRSG